MDLLRGPGETFHRVAPIDSAIDWLWVREDFACLHGAFELALDHPDHDPRGGRGVNQREGWITFRGLRSARWEDGFHLGLPDELPRDDPDRASQGMMIESLSLPDGAILGFSHGVLEVRCLGMDLELAAGPLRGPRPIPALGTLDPLPTPLDDPEAVDLQVELSDQAFLAWPWRLESVRGHDSERRRRLRLEFVDQEAVEQGSQDPPRAALIGTEVRQVRWREVRLLPESSGRFPPYEPRLSGLRRLGERFAAWGPWGSLEWEASGYRIEGGRDRR